MSPLPKPLNEIDISITMKADVWARVSAALAVLDATTTFTEYGKYSREIELQCKSALIAIPEDKDDNASGT